MLNVSLDESDVVIANGVIVKNRQGKIGGKIDYALVIEDEEKLTKVDN